MNNNVLIRLADKIIDGYQITRKGIEGLIPIMRDQPEDLFHSADKIRRKYFGKKISLCGIMNIRSGVCSEDCKFCAQSAHYSTGISIYPLAAEEKMLESAKSTKEIGAQCYGLVTSGRSVKGKDDISRIAGVIRKIKGEGKIEPSASLGCIDEESLLALKEAGLFRYHHNLETSKTFFPKICTTHAWEERVDMVKLVKEAGLQACCGGIFGLGETWEDRIDLAFTLRDLNVDSVPLNFLHSIPGTPLAKQPPLTPMEILCIISLYRFILPAKEIKVCGGRMNLRQLQSWIFYAGASGMMIGNYLTTAGRPPEEDWEMIRDLQLEVANKQ